MMTEKEMTYDEFCAKYPAAAPRCNLRRTACEPAATYLVVSACVRGDQGVVTYFEPTGRERAGWDGDCSVFVN